jgi:hypothetical protein
MPATPQRRGRLVGHDFPPEAGAPHTRLSASAAACAAAANWATELVGMPNHPARTVSSLPAHDRAAVLRRQHISSGTERAVTALARSSLLATAQAQTDLVRQGVHKARTEGIVATAQAENLLPGYFAAGQVVEVSSAVSGLQPEQPVATGGAGKASDAEFQAVPGLLCAVRHPFEKAMSGAFPVLDGPDIGIVVIATPHDTHAELVTLALKDGRHVWSEKPLVLTTDKLASIEAAWEASGRQLIVGFSCRWSPAMMTARNWLAEIAWPKFLAYRVAASLVPDGRWYADQRQGDRVRGEVCHFIDTAQVLIGADIEETASVVAGDAHAPRGADGRVVSGNGSALPTAGKEWIEVTSGSRRLVIEDFRSAKVDGKTIWRGRQYKAHRACAFKQATTGSSALLTRAMLASTHATIQAAAGGLPA